MLTYDRQITISAAGSRKATRWPAQSIYWSELVSRLATPARGTETLQQYLSLPKSQQDDLKDVGGFVAGSLAGERRKAGAVIGRDVITLDLDNIPAGGTADAVRRVDGLGCGYAIYSTRKHSEANPRLRILIPFNRTVTAEEYEAISRKLASFIGIELCDPSTFEPSRLMYWPSCCSDSQYVFTYGDKPFLDADGMLATYNNWHDLNEWPQVPGSQPTYSKLATKQGEPTEKPGVVGAFCKVYDIYSAIDKFIPGAYIPCDIGPDRLTYAGGSTTGGAVIYDGGKFLYSHHATDPAGGKLCNAFDLVRIHLFNDKDDDAKPDTPVNKLPSYIAMQALALNDQKVITHIVQDRYVKATEDFAVQTPQKTADDPNWIQKLTINPNTGRPALTINNAVLILENDPLLKNKLIFDDFSCRALVLGSVPWNKSEETRWLDNNDKAGIRNYLEKVYGITGKDRIDDAVSLVIHKHSFNAVQNYLMPLRWDGVKRVDTLFIDYLGAEDTLYTRSVTRKSLVAAVARAMTPGIKYDTMLILVGPQGIGKSTLLRNLGKYWFNDSLVTFEGKEAQELIQGSWILEIQELDAMSHSELTAVKSFLTKCEDIYRGAYLPLTEKYPRRCVFFGSTNEDEFIKDNTGGRRFWPLKTYVNKPTKNIFKDLPNEVDQVWAEAYIYWQLGEQLHLEGEAEEKAKEIQETYSESSVKEGIIRDFIEKPIPVDWNSYSIGRRLMYWRGEFNDDKSVIETKPRDRICAAEVYVECLNGELKYIRRQDTNEINAIISKIPGWIKSDKPLRFGCHGLQRGWVKDE